jgi:hypothetical protein
MLETISRSRSLASWARFAIAWKTDRLKRGRWSGELATIARRTCAGRGPADDYVVRS